MVWTENSTNGDSHWYLAQLHHHPYIWPSLHWEPELASRTLQRLTGKGKRAIGIGFISGYAFIRNSQRAQYPCRIRAESLLELPKLGPQGTIPRYSSHFLIQLTHE